MDFKRKSYQIFLLLVLELFVLSNAARAQFMFATNNGTIIITKYTGAGGTAIIPDTTNGLPVTAIGDEAFGNCINLTNVVIPESVTVIGYDVFDSCGGLVQIAIPNTITNVGDFCLFRCTSLASVSISTNITSIGNNFFAYCGSLTNIIIPNNVNTLGEAVFEACTSLTNIIIPNSVTNMGDLEFNFCGGLAGVTIGDHVANIGESTFEGCSNLTDIALPDSVTNIGTYAFLSCSSLTNLTIGSGVTNIGNDVFLDCSNLISITVVTNNPAYCSVAGVLFDKSQNTLIQYPEGKAGDFTIPQGVTGIGANAFLWCSRLTNLTIPGTITNIGEESLSPCSSMAGVYFEGAPPSLGLAVFSGDNATIYYLPDITGWGSSFGGLSTKLWNPQIQTTDGNFGLRNNQFGFNVTGTLNIPIVVETSTNLGATWMPAQSANLTNGSFYFSDPQWTISTVRFYRISSP